MDLKIGLIYRIITEKRAQRKEKPAKVPFSIFAGAFQADFRLGEHTAKQKQPASAFWATAKEGARTVPAHRSTVLKAADKR